MKSLILLIIALLARPTLARANPENDRIYQLDTLACLKVVDNVDGVFGDYMDEQFTKYFSNQNRFVQKKLKGLDEVLNNSSKPNDLLKQPEILKKISQKFKIENLIRTHVYKENDSYRFVLEWIYAPKGDVLSSVEFRYEDPQKEQGLRGSELPNAIKKGLDDLIRKLPFLGQVTGIDGDLITVSVGHNQNLKPRDVVVLYTLQSLKRHPLLNTVEEWKWQRVGRAEVQQVEESLSFARVIETEPSQSVIRFQKVREIEVAPPVAEAQKKSASKKDVPRIGWAAGSVGVGNYARDVGIGGSASGRSGGGLSELFGIDSQIWLNSRFIVQASVQEALFKYSPKDLVSAQALPGSYSGTGSEIRIAGGYSLFPMKTVYDPMAWVHLGYKSTSLSLPTSTSDFTADSSFTSLFIGVGGSLPINEDFGGQVSLDLGVLRGADSVNLGFGDANSSSDLSFSIAGTYHLQDQIFLRLMIKLSSESMDFISGQNVSQKMFSISPAVMYYF